MTFFNFVKTRTAGKQVALTPTISYWTLTQGKSGGGDNDSFEAKVDGWWEAKSGQSPIICSADADDDTKIGCAGDITFEATRTMETFSTAKGSEDWSRFGYAWPMITVYAEEPLVAGQNEIAKIKVWETDADDKPNWETFYPWAGSIYARQHYISELDWFYQQLSSAQTSYVDEIEQSRFASDGYRIDTRVWEKAFSTFSSSYQGKTEEARN